jgi:hypothetical protein
LDYLASSGFNVVAPLGWYVDEVPSFPLVIGALMKNGFLVNKVLVMGWSAGGIVAAWALTHDSNHIINLGVVMDAELTGPSEPSTRTEPSIFETAQLAGQVSVPHLLVWGMGDSGAIGIQSAGEWFKNAGRQLVRVDPLPYTHDWLGTSTEAIVRADVISFLKNGTVGTTLPLEITDGNVTSVAYLLSNAEPRNATYTQNPGIIQMTVENSPPLGVINLVLPKVAIRGAPVILLDGSARDASYFQDENNYYLFYAYPQGTHSIIFGGQEAIPEFPSMPLALALATAVSLIAVLTPKPKFHKTRFRSSPSRCRL